MHYIYLTRDFNGNLRLHAAEIHRWLPQKISGLSVPAGLRSFLLSGGALHEGVAAEYCLRHLVWRRNPADHARRHRAVQRALPSLRLCRIGAAAGRHRGFKFVVKRSSYHARLFSNDFNGVAEPVGLHHAEIIARLYQSAANAGLSGQLLSGLLLLRSGLAYHSPFGRIRHLVWLQHRCQRAGGPFYFHEALSIAQVLALFVIITGIVLINHARIPAPAVDGQNVGKDSREDFKTQDGRKCFYSCLYFVRRIRCGGPLQLARMR